MNEIRIAERLTHLALTAPLPASPTNCDGRLRVGDRDFVRLGGRMEKSADRNPRRTMSEKTSRSALSEVPDMACGRGLSASTRRDFRNMSFDLLSAWVRSDSWLFLSIFLPVVVPPLPVVSLPCPKAKGGRRDLRL